MNSKIEVMKKAWRESATLLVLGRNMLTSSESQSTECNYKVLVMKRSKQTSFMPNGFVFPGGVWEKSDACIDWIERYKAFGETSERFDEITSVKGRRPFIFQRKEDDAIPREVSLRITAIRETFEELGLLLVKNADQLRTRRPFSMHCREFDIANWQNEWESPKNLLKMYADSKIWLPPPQCYELLRLCQINDIDKVVAFAKSRNNKETTLKFPIYYEAADGAIFAYPGDDLYPTDPCFTHTIHDSEIYKEKSCEEIRALSTKLHRYELSPSNGGFAYHMNIEPFNGNLSPVVPNFMGRSKQVVTVQDHIFE